MSSERYVNMYGSDTSDPHTSGVDHTSVRITGRVMPYLDTILESVR